MKLILPFRYVRAFHNEADSYGRNIMELSEVRKLIKTYFDEEELKTLCFDLEIDYESLPGVGKAAKTRELVAFCERDGKLAELVSKCMEIRPHVNWSDLINKPRETIYMKPPDISTGDSTSVAIRGHETLPNQTNSGSKNKTIAIVALIMILGIAIVSIVSSFMTSPTSYTILSFEELGTSSQKNINGIIQTWKVNTNNTYRWNAIDTEPPIGIARRITKPSSIIISSNFSVSTTVVVVEGQCSLVFGMGLEIEDQEEPLEFLISRDNSNDCNGLFAIQKALGDNLQSGKVIVGWTPIPLNNPSEPNILTVAVSNNKATFEINGKAIRSVNINEYYALSEGHVIKGPSSIHLVLKPHLANENKQIVLEIRDFILQVK